jgi:hypothetical protein
VDSFRLCSRAFAALALDEFFAFGFAEAPPSRRS